MKYGDRKYEQQLVDSRGQSRRKYSLFYSY